MKVTVDRSRCVASGQCVMAAAEVFGQGEDDGLVELLDESPAAELAAEVRLAMTLCPSMAITVKE